MIKNSILRVQKYLDRLSTAKGYDRECIHSFLEGEDVETSLLVSDLKALCQFASSAIDVTNTTGQAASNTTDQSRAQFDAWIRTHEEEHGAVDEASAWAAWSACSLMQSKQGGAA